jgi:hypothetical protein
MSEPETGGTGNPWWPWSLPWTTAGASAPWRGLVPQALVQPINPGWSFGNITVNSVNSTAPDVEREIVSRHSYGRQLGRMMDALGALAEALPNTAGDPRIEAFRKLQAQIDALKRQAAPQRLERLREELQQLKRDDPKTWERLRDSLQ